MINTAFQYERPRTIEEAVRHLAGADGRGCVLGGGSVLIPAMSAGLAAPTLILDTTLLDLGGIRETDGTVSIGPAATYAALEANKLVRARLPLLAAMVAEVTGGPGLWNLATLGGSACHASPASDGPGCLAAMDARFRLTSMRGSREVAAATFFRGAFEAERRPEEILTEIIVPTSPSAHATAYLKLKHSASSWPIVTASCILTGDAGQRRIRLCLGGATPVPLVMEWPVGSPIGAEAVSAMAQRICAAISTEWSDELAGPGYRRAVAGTMAERAIRAAVGIPA